MILVIGVIRVSAHSLTSEGGIKIQYNIVLVYNV